jgi:Spy/CpxP family protein refolding chaperone
MDGPGMMMAGDPTHVARMIDRLLDGMGATDAQRSQIRQIAQAAAADLNAERDADRALHDRAIELLAAPTVDAAAAESLRQQMQARHDQASKRMLQAMLDMSKVLTPEQRAKLAQRMKQRDEMMRDRMQRMQRPPEQKG